MTNSQVIEAFLEGRTKAKGSSIEIRDGVLLDYGWYPMAKIHKEPPEGYRKLIDCFRYIEVFPPYNSRTSHTHWRMLLAEMFRRNEANIVAYREPFQALFGHVPKLNGVFVVRSFFFPTSLGWALWNGPELSWVRKVGEHEVRIHWNPLHSPPFRVLGPGYRTLGLEWNVSFSLETFPTEEELERIYTRKHRRMEEAAYLVGKYQEIAEALGMESELKAAKGNFPGTSGNLGKLRQLAKRIEEILRSDEMLVRQVLSKGR
jgi:hypothetical protein